MSNEYKICDSCGNLIEFILEGGGPMTCCGKPMRVLKANTSDGAQEKHVPAVSAEGSTLCVQIGDVPHPMTAEHYIQWIEVKQGNRTQRVNLTADDEPKVEFTIDPDIRPIQVFEYCNLHGLWVKEVK